MNRVTVLGRRVRLSHQLKGVESFFQLVEDQVGFIHSSDCMRRRVLEGLMNELVQRVETVALELLRQGDRLGSSPSDDVNGCCSLLELET
jgi:hypothetical protein